MLESVNHNGHTYEECKKALKESTPHSPLCIAYCNESGGGFRFSFLPTDDHPTDITLDPGFKEFFRYCKSQDIPVIVVSR